MLPTDRVALRFGTPSERDTSASSSIWWSEGEPASSIPTEW